MCREHFLPHILALERFVFDEDLPWDNGYTAKSEGHFHAIKASFEISPRNCSEVNSKSCSLVGQHKQLLLRTLKTVFFNYYFILFSSFSYLIIYSNGCQTVVQGPQVVLKHHLVKLKLLMES